MCFLLPPFQWEQKHHNVSFFFLQQWRTNVNYPQATHALLSHTLTVCFQMTCNFFCDYTWITFASAVRSDGFNSRIELLFASPQCWSQVKSSFWHVLLMLLTSAGLAVALGHYTLLITLSLPPSLTHLSPSNVPFAFVIIKLPLKKLTWHGSSSAESWQTCWTKYGWIC